MAESPELWMFFIAHFLLFGVGALLIGFSYLAYRASGRSWTFGLSTAGFVFVTFGGILEPMYELTFKSAHNLYGRELLALQTAEGTLISIGLALLFYSIYRYNQSPTQRVSVIDDEVE
jgi:predicted cobalt transporter CbtA